MRVFTLLLALCASACSRRASDTAPPAASITPSSTASTDAERRRDTPSLPQKPLPPPVTPSMPPQLVACGGRNFFRIGERALDVFQIAAELPPPQIRGSRVAQQIDKVAVDEPQNLVSNVKDGVLVIAKGGVYRYELAKRETRRYAPLPGTDPLVAWPAPGGAARFRVHRQGETNVEEFALGRALGADAGSPEPAKAAQRLALPGFDGRSFTFLADGTPLYSTPGGLVRSGRESDEIPAPALSGPATLVFADASPERFWATDAAGHLALLEPSNSGTQPFTSRVPGVVVATALEGKRVGVLSLELSSRTYRPTVTIFSDGKEQARLTVGASFALVGQPRLDLCLIGGRPWVLVGSSRWMQLLDWNTRRLLAEW